MKYYQNILLFLLTTVLVSEEIISDIIETYNNNNPKIVRIYKISDNLEFSPKYQEVKYWISGEIKSIEFFHNGHRDGISELFFNNGQIKSKITYIQGRKNGRYESFYSNGEKKEIGDYLRGKKNGNWLNYFDNGEVKTSSNFVNGKKDGMCESFNSEGIKTQVLYYKDGIETDYIYKDKFSNKNEKLKGPISEGQRNSLWKFYDFTGRLIGKGNYEYGKEVSGIFVEYNLDSVSVIKNFINGLEEGKWIEFYENGQIKVEKHYKSGKLYGDFVYYFQDGTVLVSGSYKSGEKIGVWKFSEDSEKESMSVESSKKSEYFSNGKLKMTGNYNKQDKKHGTWSYFDKDGKRIGTVLYFDGKPKLGEYVEFHENDEVKVIGSYRNNLKDGEWKYFDESGKLLQVQNYRKNVLIDIKE